VVVGARSAIFGPMRGVGLICVDEEHDASYKQESDPRYDARTVAAKRAALEGAVALYGSATPRPESWERLERLDLGERLGGRLPPVRIVDLRREAGYPLSAPLLAELGKLAENGGKAILLLNRRGIASALLARLAELARERGIRTGFVLTEPDNGPANALYRSAGGATEPRRGLAVRCDDEKDIQQSARDAADDRTGGRTPGGVVRDEGSGLLARELPIPAALAAPVAGPGAAAPDCHAVPAQESVIVRPR
jgi:GNAT superfamily N-acetyltransferase